MGSGEGDGIRERIDAALDRLIDERMDVGLTSPEAFVVIAQARTRIREVLEDDPTTAPVDPQ